MSKTQNISQRVSKLRKAMRLSQEDFAKRLGISRNYVSMIELGREPSEALLNLITRLEKEQMLPAAPKETSTEYKTNGPRAKLKLLREKKGYTLAQFAKTLGYSDPGTYREIEEGGSRMAEKMAEKAAKLLGCEVDDLTNGSDHPPERDGVFGTFGATPNIALPQGMKGKYMPLIAMAQCGPNVAFTDGDYTGQGFFVVNPEDPKAFAITLAGDSMSPRFEPGDVAIVYPSKPPKNGGVVIARLDDDHGGDVMLKLYQASRDDVILSSYNPAYPAMTFHRRAFAWIYPVVMVSKVLH